MTSSGEGGPLRLAAQDMRWESLQAASGHFGITGADLRRVRDVEIKINQGAKPGKGGRLASAKVTPTVSKARNIPVGTDALSPDPKHDIYSIEDMPAEVWLWLLYQTYSGIKITGSNYTRYVAAGMWSNFVVDYLLIDAGTGGSGNYHGDSAHVGWPDAFRTILHTHHALMGERVDLDGSGEVVPIRDGNGAVYGAAGNTRLLASGGLRGELDMLKVLIAGADALVEGTIGKAAAFGCTQCVHMIESFRLRVVRLKLLIAYRPVLRHAVGGAVRLEILFAQPEQGGAVHLGRAADEVMHPGLERLAVTVVPGLLRHIAVLDKHGGGVPILLLARQIIAAFQDENALAARRELQRQRSAAGTAADDDDVVTIPAHAVFLSISGGPLGGRSSFAMRPVHPV